MDKHSFLNFVYICGDKKLYELVEFEESDFINFRIRYVTKVELEEILKDDNVVKDFYFENGYLGWAGDSVDVSPDMYEQTVGRQINVTTPNEHIYKWLWQLVLLDARYLTNDAFEHIVQTNSLPEWGTVRMSGLKVSRSTMRVYLSVLREEGWRVETIVGNNKGLYFNPFYFMLEKEKSSGLVLSECVYHVKDVEIVGNLYSIFKVEDGISLYPQFHPVYRIAPPILNHKMLVAEKDKAAADFLDHFIKSAEMSVFNYEEPKEEEYEKVSRDYETDKSGVFFKLGVKHPARKAFHNMLVFVADANENVIKGEWNLEDIKREMDNMQYTILQKYACLSLLAVFLKCPSGILTKIDAARKVREEIRVKSLKIELELFAIRSYIFVTDYTFPEYATAMILEGGRSATYTELSKVDVGGF